VTSSGGTNINISFPGKTSPGVRYLVDILPDTDRLEQPNNPFRWKPVTYLPSTQTSFTYKYAWELETYTVRVRTVAPDIVAPDGTILSYGTVSAGVTTTVSIPQWVPQNQLLLYSEDFSQATYWPVDAGVTVTSAGGAASNGYVVNFGAVNRAFSQSVPTLALSGRTYTVGFEIKGAAGQTISLFAHAARYPGDTNTAYNMPTNWTLTGGWDWVTFVRPPTGTTERFLRVGVQTYNGATATSVNVRRARVALGTLTTGNAGTLATGYEATTGPGTTWQEPILFNDNNVAAGGLAWAGWHRNVEDPTVAT